MQRKFHFHYAYRSCELYGHYMDSPCKYYYGGKCYGRPKYNRLNTVWRNRRNGTGNSDFDKCLRKSRSPFNNNYYSFS